MKYILWGAGLRGKRALKLIGNENVQAFVEGNPQRVGQIFMGKRILSFDQALEEYPDCIYIITPLLHDGIEEQLDSKGIYARFCLDESPMEFAFVDEDRELFEIYPIKIEEKKCGIYGITLFSLLLYEYLQKSFAVRAVLCPQDGFDERLLKLLSKEYEIASVGDAASEIERWIAVRDYDLLKERQGNLKKIDNITELMEQNINFCNPEIRKLKGVYRGKRCFIIATGPSLLPTDLDTLHKHGEICFSMNKIYNIFDRTKWRPDFYFIQDYYMINEIAETVADLNLPYKFVTAAPSSYWEQEKAKSSIKFYSVIEKIDTQIPKFGENLEHYAYDGKTVTYACLQMAAYMGFREIYLLGVDFNYTNKLGDMQNHFVGYNADKPANTLFPFMREQMQAGYESAKKYADAHGIKIYNATRGGKLEVFERVDFEQLFRTYRSVALCGYRKHGRELYIKLIESGIKIPYIIERNYQALSVLEKELGIPIVGFGEDAAFYQSAEAILLTGDLPEDLVRESLGLAKIALPLLSEIEV